MLELIKHIDEYANENPANPAVCGKNNIVTFEELRNAIINICKILDYRKIEKGSKAYINISGSDLRLAATLACLHYEIVPFILWQPENIAGQVDYDLVISARSKIVSSIPGDITIDGTIFSRTKEPLDAWGRQERLPDDLIAIGVTSGTTGVPKLLAMTNRQLVKRSAARRALRIPGRTMTTYGSYSIASFEMTNQLIAAGTTQVRSDLDPVTSLKLINLFLVERLTTSPKTIEALMLAMEQTGIKCPSIRAITLAGSLFDPSLLSKIERFFNAVIYVGYGTSETGPIARNTVTDSSYVPGYVGEICTPLDLQTVPHQESGKEQFRVRNDIDYVLRTYRDGDIVADDSTEYLIPDIGYIKDKQVYILGRTDEVYNLSGTKFAFSEIARFIMSIENIDDAAVIRDPDDPDPFGLQVAIVHQRPVDVNELMDLLCKRLNRRTARKHIRIYDLASLPRNAAGKVDRMALLERMEQEMETVP